MTRETDMDTATFAIIDDSHTITEVLELTDDEIVDRTQRWNDTRFSQRLVYLPMGGEVGDTVEVDEDGEARVVDGSYVDADGDCSYCGHPANGSSGHGGCDADAHR